MWVRASALLLFALLTRASIIPDTRNGETNEVAPSASTGRSSMALPSCDGLYVCLKLRALDYLESVSRVDELALMPGVRVVRQPSAESEDAELDDEMARSLSDKDPQERLDDYLAYKLGAFLESRNVQIGLFDDEQTARDLKQNEAEDDGDLTEEGRGRRKKRKIKKIAKIFGIAVAIKKFLVKKLLGGLILKVIFIMAFKALQLSKLALLGLVISKIGSIVSLFGGGGKSGKGGNGASGGAGDADSWGGNGGSSWGGSSGGSGGSWGGSGGSGGSWGGNGGSGGSWGGSGSSAGSSSYNPAPAAGGPYRRSIDIVLPERLASPEH